MPRAASTEVPHMSHQNTDPRDVLALIDDLIGPDGGTVPSAPTISGPPPAAGLEAARGARLAALASRAARSAGPPPGEVLVPAVEPRAEWTPRPVEPGADGDRHAAPNMGAAGPRIDHWDAYVCRFDQGEDGPDRFRL